MEYHVRIFYRLHLVNIEPRYDRIEHAVYIIQKGHNRSVVGRMHEIFETTNVAEIHSHLKGIVQ